MADKIFADGFFAEKKEIATAPYIKASVSVKVSEAIPFLQKHENNGGYVNLTLKESRGGNYYLELNTYEPVKKEVSEPEEEINLNNPPF